MTQYIIEAIAIQLVFLVIYDLFLKRETFFQWNRLYLIATYTLSLVLPWVKIEALKTTVPEQYYVYPEFFWNMEGVTVTPSTTEGFLSNLPWSQVLLFGGMVTAALLFAFKLYKIQQLRNKGKVQYFPNFTRIVVQNSSLAFSFFRSIFMGDKVLEKEHESIIRHELVHIEQKHSWDLIFFELMRIGCWFNPLVYIYQNRISELHEFIADAEVAKIDKKESYQLLLSEVFQTEHISFINQFFKSSLIKKRIVMLQKSKSKSIWKLKYLALVPILLGILFYTSCETEEKLSPENIEVSEDVDVPFAVIDEVPIFPGCEGSEDPRDCFNKMIQKHISKNFRYPEGAVIKGVQGRVSTMFVIQKDGSIGGVRMRGPDKLLEDEAARIIAKLPKMIPGKQKGEAVRVPFSIPITFKLAGGEDNSTAKDNNTDFDEGVAVPFAVIEEVPIFPGCEDAIDKRACFNEKIQRHISKNFRYPLEAQEKGIQGRVSILFVIREDGSIGGLRMRGPDKLLEDEAARIISKLPQMSPGKQKGNAVQVPFSIPITFKLQGPNENETSEANIRKTNSGKMQVLGYRNKNGENAVYGTITDGSQGLPGVNVTVQGSSRGVVSDFDGRFAIEAQKGEVIAFQYTGLPTAKLTVNDQNKYFIEAVR